MVTVAADGTTCSPMIVYPYKRIPEKIAQCVPPEWGIARNYNGWMTAEVLYEYVTNLFHPYLVKNKITLPVILFVDGHKSHITYDLSLLCNQLQIELIALYPNATRILQPADVAAFCLIKASWRKTVIQFYLENPGEMENKANIASLLKNVVDSLKAETLKNGFGRRGLYPFNPDAVDYTKCLASTTVNKDSVQNTNALNLEPNQTLSFKT